MIIQLGFKTIELRIGCPVKRPSNDTSINDQVIDEQRQTMALQRFLMHKVLEHEAYHRGQLAAYLKVLTGETE